MFAVDVETGVGKTTTSILLTAGLAHRGKEVLLIDIDSQANSSKVLVDDFSQLHADERIYIITAIDRQLLHGRTVSCNDSMIYTGRAVDLPAGFQSTSLWVQPTPVERKLNGV